jgi:tetratricopeptide (TPR) repeat protein
MNIFSSRCATLALLIAISAPAFSQEAHPATVKESVQKFTSYPYSDPNPIPLPPPVYPYFRWDGFTSVPVEKEWKTVVLENDYIRVMILPEIGGKIWAATEKKTGAPFLYYNHVVKFRDVAMRGPWTSGGLEANYGIIGHTPACSSPVDYLVRTNGDGSVSCIIGTLDLLTRSYWRMEIRLPSDKAFFQTRSFWYNTTPLEQPYYHWMNAGLKASDDLEFIYPGNRYIGHGGEYAAWPVNEKNGKLISWYKNNDFGEYKSYHVFGRYADFSGAYWHKEDRGMIRFGTHDDKPGKKLWIWGLSRQGMIWEKLLTDKDGQYFELQSGRLFNQNTAESSLTPFKHRGFAPYGTDSWEECWYPVDGTHGIVAASEYGALNLQIKKGLLRIYLSPVQAIRDTLRIAIAGREIYKRPIRVKPLELYKDSVELSAGGVPASRSNQPGTPLDEALPDALTVELGDHLLDYSTQAEDSIARPVQAPSDFNWNSAYGHYLQGCEAMDMKDYHRAGLALDSALEKDANYLPALVKKAELLFRNMRYAEALKLAKHALSIHTEDGSANFIYGLVNDRLGNNTDARDGFDIASQDPAYRSAAYTSLARRYLRMGWLSRALDCTSKALVAQSQNMDALQLRAVLYRLQGDTAQHRATLRDIQSMDALNHFSRWEYFLADSMAHPLKEFTSLIRGELPQEVYLEMACWYYDCGLKPEAIRLLRLCPPVAEAKIWLSYLTAEPLDLANLDPTRAFPFRWETGQVLETMMSKYSSWFLRYQLALIYWDRDRPEEARKLLMDCGDEPSFAPFYAWRAAMMARDDTDAVRRDLLRATQLDPHWRYAKLLAEYYLLHNDPVKAGDVAEKSYLSHPDNYIMGMLYARTLLLNHEFAACDRLLASLNIIPFEGATIGRELYRETKLMLAVQEMKKHAYKKALVRIDEARQWPEHLGVGAPYPEDQDLRLEDWMSHRCYAALGQDKEARGALEKIHAEWAKTLLAGGKPDQQVVREYLKNKKESNQRIIRALED